VKGDFDNPRNERRDWHYILSLRVRKQHRKIRAKRPNFTKQ
jgi:hypothetical protein